MNKIDISIIVPIYNAEKYLKKCLDSLVNQTKKELEFILINDGSTDKSEEIVKTYKDERIKYFKNKNQGIGKTRNFGIEKAKGEFLTFLDADDEFFQGAFEKAKADVAEMSDKALTIIKNTGDNEFLEQLICRLINRKK